MRLLKDPTRKWRSGVVFDLDQCAISTYRLTDLDNCVTSYIHKHGLTAAKMGEQGVDRSKFTTVRKFLPGTINPVGSVVERVRDHKEKSQNH